MLKKLNGAMLRAPSAAAHDTQAIGRGITLPTRSLYVRFG